MKCARLSARCPFKSQLNLFGANYTLIYNDSGFHFVAVLAFIILMALVV